MVDRRSTIEDVMVILEEFLTDPAFCAEEFDNMAGYTCEEIRGMLRDLNSLYSEMDDDNP